MEDAASDAKREDGSLSNAGATGEEQETADDEKADDGGALEEEAAASSEKDAMDEDHDGAGVQEAETKEEDDDNDDKEEDQDEDDAAQSEGARDANEGDDIKGDDEGEQDGEEQDDADKSALEQEEDEDDEDGEDVDAAKKEETEDKSSKNDAAESDAEVEDEGEGEGEEEGKGADKDDNEKDEALDEKEDTAADSEGGAQVKKEEADESGAPKSAGKPADGDAGDVEMKEIKNEGEGGAGDGEDGEDAASSGKKVDASNEGVAEAQADGTESKAKTNGLTVNTSMDEDEAVGEDEKEEGKERTVGAVSEHQEGAPRLAAANRAPSPSGSKDAVSASKAQLAAKLKSRPQMAQVQIGNVVVKRLGNIVHDRPAYHTRRFIYPVGFLSERTYASYRQPGSKTVYVCEVLDGGRAPEFKITVIDDMDNPIVAADPTAAWRVVEQRVQAVPPSPADSRPPAVQRLCGAAYFGLAHPSVIKRLQELVGAKKCSEFPYEKKYQQLHEIVQEDEKSAVQSGTPVSPPQPAPVASKNSSGSGVARGEGSNAVGSRVAVTDPDLAGEWLPVMEKVLPPVPHSSLCSAAARRCVLVRLYLRIFSCGHL